MGGCGGEVKSKPETRRNSEEILTMRNPEEAPPDQAKLIREEIAWHTVVVEDEHQRDRKEGKEIFE